MNTYLIIIIILSVVLVILIFKLGGLYEKMDKTLKNNLELSNELSEFKNNLAEYKSRAEDLSRTVIEDKRKIELLEADTLKFQLQPHTLRNLFAQMQVITNKLNRSWDFLSSQLEYIFYKGKDHFVTVADEISFVESYLALNNVFIEEIGAIRFDHSNINEQILHSGKKQIPHLITAYLLENAFKHGDKSDKNFIYVKIFAKDDFFEIMVRNKNKVSINSPKKHGIGLVNMKKRLDIFVPSHYEYTNFCDQDFYTAQLKITF